MAKITMREAISQALWEEMERDPSVFILGEEVGVWANRFHSSLPREPKLISNPKAMGPAFR